MISSSLIFDFTQLAVHHGKSIFPVKGEVPRELKISDFALWITSFTVLLTSVVKFKLWFVLTWRLCSCGVNANEWASSEQEIHFTVGYA